MIELVPDIQLTETDRPVLQRLFEQEKTGSTKKVDPDKTAGEEYYPKIQLIFIKRKRK